MDENTKVDQDHKEFSFPMSKQDKIVHDHLESNIHSIIDDDDESIPSITKSQINQSIAQSQA